MNLKLSISFNIAQFANRWLTDEKCKHITFIYERSCEIPLLIELFSYLICLSNLFLRWQSSIFSIITPVFSVTWPFRNPY